MASAALAACATSRMSTWEPMIRLNPSRKIGWSSTLRIVIGVLGTFGGPITAGSSLMEIWTFMHFYTVRSIVISFTLKEGEKTAGLLLPGSRGTYFFRMRQLSVL